MRKRGRKRERERGGEKNDGSKVMKINRSMSYFCILDKAWECTKVFGDREKEKEREGEKECQVYCIKN